MNFDTAWVTTSRFVVNLIFICLINSHSYAIFCFNLEFAFRECSSGGTWVGRHANETTPNGWTNYTPCFPPLVQSLFYKVYDDEGDAQVSSKWPFCFIDSRVL